MNNKGYYIFSLLVALSLSSGLSLASLGFSPSQAIVTSPQFAMAAIVKPQPNLFNLAFERANQVFVSQVISKYNPTARSDSNPNCGPASLVMITRWLGLPMFQDSDRQVAVDRARLALTGSSIETGIAITNFSQYTNKQNIPTRLLTSLEQFKSALNGKVVILAQGNPFAEERINAKQVNRSYAYRIESRQYGACTSPFLQKGCSHFIVVLAYDARDQLFIINDPLRKQGPIVISEDELAVFLRSEGIRGLAFG